MRYFRSTLAAYVMAAENCDTAYGYPNHATRTERTLPLPETLPTDGDGRVYLTLSVDQCDNSTTTGLLAGLIASGAVEEIDEATYQAVAGMP